MCDWIMLIPPWFDRGVTEGDVGGESEGGSEVEKL